MERYYAVYPRRCGDRITAGAYPVVFYGLSPQVRGSA